MSAQVLAGRYTAEVGDDGVVVFLIGMRINRLRAIRKWRPVAAAMPAMIRQLMQRPELGLLEARTFVSGRTILVVQYWRSVEQLQAFARSPEQLHLPAWRRFNAAARGNDAVGIYHETYVVQPGQVETIYVDMPRALLGKAVAHVPVRAGRHSAAARLSGDDTIDDPALPVG